MSGRYIKAYDCYKRRSDFRSRLHFHNIVVQIYLFYIALMTPFASTDQMIETHERMFGDAGRFCAEALCRYIHLFDEPFDPLRIRIVLAPVEIGPYNRHYGYTYKSKGSFHLILGNRHICQLSWDGSVALIGPRCNAEDFIVHELTHHRQRILLARNDWKQNGARGCHRDKGWYAAIAEAAPRYLGVAFPESLWPKMKSKRMGATVIKVQEPGRIKEVEACHWPRSFRKLISRHDPRLRPIWC